MLNAEERAELGILAKESISNGLSHTADWFMSIPAPGLANTAVILAGLWLAVFVRNKFKYPRGKTKSPLGLPGKIIYADKGKNSEIFSSRKYNLVAKPDFVLKLKTGEYALVEYKGRDSDNVYASDIVQAKASVLAVRDKYPIELAFVVTGSGKCVQVPLGSSEEVHNSIKFALDEARRRKVAAKA